MGLIGLLQPKILVDPKQTVCSGNWPAQEEAAPAEEVRPIQGEAAPAPEEEAAPKDEPTRWRRRPRARAGGGVARRGGRARAGG